MKVSTVWVVVTAGALLICGAGNAQVVTPEDYGLAGTNYTFVSAEEFVAAKPDHCFWWRETHNFWYNAGATPCNFYAPVDLPAGALMTRLMVLYHDSSATEIIDLYFTRYWMDTLLGTTGWEDIVIFSSVGEPGNDLEIVEIDPDETYSVVSGISRFQSYVLRAYMPANNTETMLRGVIVQWKRQISPAPPSQTFPDVNPSFWAFQEIEALAASEITTGFPDGTFRPTEPVTRAQMATFLARALGLHWAP